MKNLFNSKSFDILAKDQLKTIVGGQNQFLEVEGSCTATLTCNTGSISCSSDSGSCSRGWGTITCDGTRYEC